MVDFFGAVNSGQIHHLSNKIDSQDKLSDARERAALIKKKTGQEPESFSEFQEHHKPSLGTILKGLGIGGIVGGGTGFLVGMALGGAAILPFAVGIGALACAAIGVHAAFGRNMDVVAYDDYLKDFEKKAASTERGPSQAPALAQSQSVDVVPPLATPTVNRAPAGHQKPQQTSM